MASRHADLTKMLVRKMDIETSTNQKAEKSGSVYFSVTMVTASDVISYR